MTSIITGDIVNSREVNNPDEWMLPFKKILSVYGKSPKVWEIYRGDSFQLEVKKAEESLLAAINIKACIKSIKGLDVRMAIGIGDKTYDAPRITEANGAAFIYSGEHFEKLKKFKQHLAVRTPWPDIDDELNVMISLATIIMGRWSSSSAALILLSLQNTSLSQKELGNKIGRTQSTVSERQTRAYYAEIMKLEAFYRKRISQQLAIS
jgi:hypothetical protein